MVGSWNVSKVLVLFKEFLITVGFFRPYKNKGSREMSLSAKCLVYKHEDLIGTMAPT